MTWLLLAAGVAAAVFLADRVLLRLEEKGRIDYRRTYPGRIAADRVGPAFLAVQSLFQSGARHHLEETEAIRTERDVSGDGDGPDAPRRGPA